MKSMNIKGYEQNSNNILIKNYFKIEKNSNSFSKRLIEARNKKRKMKAKSLCKSKLKLQTNCKQNN